MADRYIDKKIQVLELICKDDFRHDDVSNYGLNITDDELIKIVKEFQWSNLLTVLQVQLISDADDDYKDFLGIKEESDITSTKNDIDINYQIKDKNKLAILLKKLKENYPKRDEPVIREQTLEKIARHFGEMTTATNIISLLKKWGASESLIIYPETKWKVIFNVLNYYAVSKKPEDYNTLMNIIEEIVHPLLYEGNFEESKKVADSFNALLYYDNFDLRFSADSKKYKLSYEPTDQEMDEVNEQTWEEFCQQQEEQAKNDKIFYEKTENKEGIEMLRKYYQIFINIVETFCQNPTKPSHEFNDAYLKIYNTLQNTIARLRKAENKPLEIQSLSQTLYFPFYSSNLFGAESVFNRNNQQLSWENIRPKMNYAYGEIDDIFRKINGSDIISEASIQQTLNDVSLLLSKTKEENEVQKINSQKHTTSKSNNILKVEITGMPELKIKPISEDPIKQISKIKLATSKVSFDDNEPKIIAGKAECILPPFKNEHYFCRSMFKHLPKEFIDWSIIYTEMCGNEPNDHSKNKRAVQDTMYAVNNRIKEILPTDDDLFTWKEKSVVRNY